MTGRNTRLDEARTLYARMMAAASGSSDPRLERIFELVPREAFLPPGPWHIMVEHRVIETPSADPAHLYQNALVVLDRQKGINNGEPFLHAAWIGAVAPGPGETVTQVGAGGGYYTAVLSMLVLPGGKVVAYEVDTALSQAARRNLVAFENVADRGERGDLRLPRVRYHLRQCRGGRTAASMAEALRPGGRFVFPWRPGTATSALPLATRHRADLRSASSAAPGSFRAAAPRTTRSRSRGQAPGTPAR